MQALKALKVDYLKGTQKSNWGRERRLLDKKDPEIDDYHVWIVVKWNRRVRFRDEQRQEMTLNSGKWCPETTNILGDRCRYSARGEK